MIVPSIDLMDGRAVQLVQGRRKVLDAGDPRPIAERFARVGEVAVVDLDAALGRSHLQPLHRKTRAEENWSTHEHRVRHREIAVLPDNPARELEVMIRAPSHVVFKQRHSCPVAHRLRMETCHSACGPATDPRQSQLSLPPGAAPRPPGRTKFGTARMDDGPDAGTVRPQTAAGRGRRRTELPPHRAHNSICKPDSHAPCPILRARPQAPAGRTVQGPRYVGE